MSEPFAAATWFASMHEAGQDVLAVEFVEGDLQLVVTGRSYDNTRDAERWSALSDHRAAIIAFLSTRDQEQAA